jgi:hypothetical protein
VSTKGQLSLSFSVSLCACMCALAIVYAILRSIYVWIHMHVCVCMCVTTTELHSTHMMGMHNLSLFKEANNPCTEKKKSIPTWWKLPRN